MLRETMFSCRQRTLFSNSPTIRGTSLAWAGMSSPLSSAPVISRLRGALLRKGLSPESSVRRSWEARVALSCSLGVAFSKDVAGDIRILLRHADLALYDAKAKGHNAWSIFDENMKRRRVVVDP